MPAATYDQTATARLVAEPAKATPSARSPFARDRARVLHSAALRRLAAKTQVVGVGVDDFPRTRLTHSLECAQIGRELATSLGADPDAVDAACLAHDLGHPPFGHTGEAALDEAAASCGGFEGNAQSLRVLTRLEAKIDGAGLNLTRAVLDAATKYPWPKRGVDDRKYGTYVDDLPAFRWVREPAPEGARCLEAEVMDWADDVAYSVHDLEDGVVSGATPLDRLDAEAVAEVASADYSAASPAELADALRRLQGQDWWPPAYDGSMRAQAALKGLTSELIGRFSAAAVAATRARYGDGPLVRYGAGLVVPPEAHAECAVLKAVTAHYVMRARRSQAREQHDVVLRLVTAVADRAPDALEPALRGAFAAATDDAARLRVVIDQVASLTDTSARAWLRRLTS